jgi:hypothetical protein
LPRYKREMQWQYKREMQWQCKKEMLPQYKREMQWQYKRERQWQYKSERLPQYKREIAPAALPLADKPAHDLIHQVTVVMHEGCVLTVGMHEGSRLLNWGTVDCTFQNACLSAGALSGTQ